MKEARKSGGITGVLFAIIAALGCLVTLTSPGTATPPTSDLGSSEPIGRDTGPPSIIGKALARLSAFAHHVNRATRHATTTARGDGIRIRGQSAGVAHRGLALFKANGGIGTTHSTGTAATFAA